VAERIADDSAPKPGQSTAGSQPATSKAIGATDRHSRGESVAIRAPLFAIGLGVLGVLAAGLVLLEPNPRGDPAVTSVAVSWLRALWLVLAFGLAAAASFIGIRSSAKLVRELFDRDSRRLYQLTESLDRTISLLERVAQALEHRAASMHSEQPPDSGPAHPASTLQDRMAELKAARDVNDPPRVLELYRSIAAALDSEPRAALQSEIAEWFLTVIYRRLRTGKIQVEVVELAAQFAETFAATTQGASVRAALPTLRRSAGLCPRCAQPYIGTAPACPDCLRAGSAPTPSHLPASDPAESE
jgi:hypothetical protein